ncbi:MAG: ribonuclease Z [Methanomassiliicoccales archaeon]|nr:ribonuclease Z [Methanomassiliicoccales archaeon]TFG57482.1 MAG: ribonuclease Z [Methanomassiliicoccus sp.]
MDLTFLGTGGSVPTTKRNTMSIALRRGSEVLLFDCGEGTQRQLMSSSVSFMRITRIFITHHHGDHFLGLPGLIQSMNFYGRTAVLEIYGPEGTADLVTRLLGLGTFDLQYQVHGMDLAPGQTVAGEGYRITAFGTAHTTPSLGFAFHEEDRPGRFDPQRALDLGIKEGPNFSRLVHGESVMVGEERVTPEEVMGPPRKGLNIVYSGDSSPCQEMRDASQGADVLIHEATVTSDLSEKAKEYGHSTSKDAAVLAKDVDAKVLYLVHISGRYDEVEPLLLEAQGIFPNTIIPSDLDTFIVRKE